MRPVPNHKLQCKPRCHYLFATFVCMLCSKIETSLKCICVYIHPGQISFRSEHGRPVRSSEPDDVRLVWAFSSRSHINTYHKEYYHWNRLVPVRAVARVLIVGGGGCIFIYSSCARLVSFEIKLISKEVSRAEPEYMNIHPPPPISVLATTLVPVWCRPGLM